MDEFVTTLATLLSVDMSVDNQTNKELLLDRCYAVLFHPFVKQPPEQITFWIQQLELLQVKFQHHPDVVEICSECLLQCKNIN